MKLLDKHILTELLGPFLFGVAAFTSLMFAGQDLFKITEMLGKFHAPIGDIVKLVLLRMPMFVVYTLPMAMLLATLLGFGRLSGDSEVVALFAGGISLYRIAVPVAIVALSVTGISFVISEIVVPSTSMQFETIRAKLVNEPLKTDKSFAGVVEKDGITSTVFYVQRGIDAEKGTLKDVVVMQYRENKPAAFIYGSEARWNMEDNTWAFMNGYWKSLNTGHTMTMTFSNSETHIVKLDRTPKEMALLQKGADAQNNLSFAQLRSVLKMLNSSGQDINTYRVQLYQKISIPLATLVFALIGTPLGLRPHRSSSAMGLGLSIVIIFAYWVLMNYMSILGNSGVIHPAAASFIPTIAGIAAGVSLIVRAAK